MDPMKTKLASTLIVRTALAMMILICSGLPSYGQRSAQHRYFAANQGDDTNARAADATQRTLTRPASPSPAIIRPQNSGVGHGTTEFRQHQPLGLRPAGQRPRRQPATAMRFADIAGGAASPVQLASALEAAVTRKDEDGVLPPTKESIRQQIEQTARAMDLPAETREECLQRLNKALDWLNEETDATQKIAEYRAEIEQSGVLISETKARLAEPVSAAPPTPPEDIELAKLEQHLAGLEAALNDAQRQLAKREEELKKRGQRKAQLASLLSETSSRLEEARADYQNLAAESESPSLTMARSWELSTRIAALEKQLEMYRVEGERHEALGQALPLTRDLAAKELAIQEQRFASWQKAVAGRRKSDAEKQAQEARQRAEQSHPALRKLAERNAQLAEVRSELAEKIETVAASLKTSDERSNLLHTQLDSATQRVAKAGHSTSVGIMLRKLRETLPSKHEYEARTHFVSQEMPQANLQRLELDEERSDLSHFEGAVSAVMAELNGTFGGLRPEYVERAVRETLGARKDVLDQLLNDYDFYLETLSKLDVTDREVLFLRDKLGRFVNEHVLWIRSTKPLDVAYLRQLPAAAKTFLSAEQWRADARTWWQGVAAKPLVPAAALFFVFLLTAGRDPLRHQLQLVSNSGSAKAQLSLSPTLRSAGLTLLLASQWPAVLYGYGWFISRWEYSGVSGLAIGNALSHAAFLFWIIELTGQVCRAEGLAENYFGWMPPVLNSIRSNLQWFRLISLPTLFASSFCAYYRDGAFSDSLGRIAFILLWGSVGALIHCLLRPHAAISRDVSVRNLEGWLARLWNGLYLIALSLPIVLIGLAIIGFHFSAQELALRFEITLALVLGSIVAHELVSRWILIKRRAIVLREAREAKSQAEEASTNPAAPSDAVVAPLARRDLNAIHEQIRILLRHATTIGFVIGLWFTWVNVLPALNILDRVELWTTNVEMTELVRAPDGNLTPLKIDRPIATTLRSVLMAFAILVIAFALGKNLPALLEFTILDRLPLDGGARHAATFLLRYALSVSAIVLACRSLHVTWSSVQWLAAAMTVGLGFGLQEIFANLVSGLIILFERPVRVGDIVTVGQVTGTVTAMRMRATTITDFDRRELVVPNKKFITEDVMNWTLSDRISRVVIPVGVAYGSDTALTHSTLLQVAHAHPLVLEDPEPTAMFKGFGDSTLNFDLRVFIPNRDVYTTVVHEINSAIDRAFRAADIEIAFPQRDINIRSVVPLPSFVAQQPEYRRHAA